MYITAFLGLLLQCIIPHNPLNYPDLEYEHLCFHFYTMMHIIPWFLIVLKIFFFINRKKIKFTWYFKFYLDVSHIKPDFSLEITNSQMQGLILLKHNLSSRKYFNVNILTFLMMILESLHFVEHSQLRVIKLPWIPFDRCTEGKVIRTSVANAVPQKLTPSQLPLKHWFGIEINLLCLLPALVQWLLPRLRGGLCQHL